MRFAYQWNASFTSAGGHVCPKKNVLICGALSVERAQNLQLRPEFSSISLKVTKERREEQMIAWGSLAGATDIGRLILGEQLEETGFTSFLIGESKCLKAFLYLRK